MTQTNKTLLDQVRDPGNQTAWREFDRIYRPLLTQYAQARGLKRDMAEEIVQECMKLLAQKMRDFEYSSSRGRFRGWLRKMVTNKIIDSHRKRNEVAAGTADLLIPTDEAAQPDAAFDRIWRREHLRYCLKLVEREFSAQAIDVFKIYVLQEKTAAEVASALGVSESLVWTTRTRIVARLREVMTQLFGNDLAEY